MMLTAYLRPSKLGEAHFRVLHFLEDKKLGKHACVQKEIASQTYSLRATVVFFSSKPRLCILSDSDEESSSAGSSDEEEAPPSEAQGPLGDKTTGAAADG